ncbi:MAG: phosphate ABC transporter permease PstA [Actinomycetota bacterium]
MIAATSTRPLGLSSARKAKDTAFTAFIWFCAALALIPLAIITVYVVSRGWHALSVNFFTKEPAGPLDASSGGIVQSFIGTGIIVGIAALIAIPLGVLTAVYLSEYGRGKFAAVVRFVAETLLSTPSIVAGAFIWAVFVVTTGHFSAIAGSLSVAVLMWPIIVRATEDILRLVSPELREGALALGVPRWKVVLRIVIPTAGAGILTAIMLAVARGLGETAPILLTALGNDYINTNPNQPTDAVPLRIYNYARTPVEALHTFAWGGAIMLLVGVLVLSISARLLSARQQRRMG